jgi:hypothetical protein
VGCKHDLRKVTTSYILLPEGGGQTYRIKLGAYIVPIGWGYRSEEFEEKLHKLLEEYFDISDGIPKI